MEETTTFGISDHYGWYHKRPAKKIESYEEGYQYRGRPYSLGGDAGELADQIDRHYYAVLNYQKKDVLKEKLCKSTDGGTYFEGGESPLPNYDEIYATALFVDIDLKDAHKERSLPSEKKKIFSKVIEKMIKEFERLVGEDHVFLLDSVGGVYIFTAPGVTAPISDLNSKGKIFDELTDRMNDWIKKKRIEVLESVDGAEEICKMDAINNKNRQYKGPLSLHKEIDGVVHPIDTATVEYKLIRKEDVDSELISKVKEWCVDFTTVPENHRPLDKMISDLFPDFYEGDWKVALKTWVEEEKEKEKRRKKITEDRKERREERRKKNINLADLETTDNWCDVVDAVNRIDVKEIVKKYASDEFDTSNRSSEITFNPSWRESESGKSCAIPEGENRFIDNKVDKGGGPLKAYALGVGLISTPAEKLDGRTFWKAVEGLSEGGYDIPILEKGSPKPDLLVSVNKPDDVSDLPVEPILIDDRPRRRHVEKARKKTLDCLVDALESQENILIDALPSLGKSNGIIKAAKETHTPLTVLTDRGHKEQYKQIEEWCEDENLSYKRLPSFFQSCPTATGEHGEEWKDKVKDWYERGLTPQQIHKYCSPPCQKDGACPYSMAWNFDPEYYDVLIGHYLCAHLPKVTKKRTVVFDEFPEDAFEEKFSAEKLKKAISDYLQDEDRIPFQNITDLLENRDDEKRREKALEYLDGMKEKTPTWVLDSEETHSLTPTVIHALLEMVGDEDNTVNGYERKRYFDKNKHLTVLHNRATNRIHVMKPPNLYYCRQIIALDGTPIKEMWEISLGGARLEHRQVLDDSERKKYLKEGLNHHFIRTTEHMKPYSSGNYVNIESDRLLLQKLTELYDQRPSMITTKKAKDQYQEEGLLTFVDDHTHYGNLKGSNKLKKKRLGVVIGSNHCGDDYIKKWGAYQNEGVEREGRGEDTDYGDFGNKIYRHMTHNATLQAVMRFGRDGQGAVVYVETNTLPDWVPHETQPGVINIWSDGMKKVFSEAKKREEFTTKTIAKKIDLSKRQVRRCLNELEEKTDTLVKKKEGVAYKWINQGLNGINPGGDTELEGESPYQSPLEGPRPPDGIESRY